ncbi:MAG: SMR family transporter [archaeon]|nr:SMR family transporter [archaeon]
MIDLICVIVGGFFEPAWVFSLEKAGRCDSRRSTLFWYAACLIFMYCSLMFLSWGMRTMNVGISYAIWTAVGAIVTIVISRLFLDESLNKGKILSIMMILIGISGLELAGGL